MTDLSLQIPHKDITFSTGAAGYVLEESETTADSYKTIGTNYYAIKWTASASYSLTAIEVFAHREDNPSTETITAYIYSDDGGEPDTSLGNSSAVLKTDWGISADWGSKLVFSSPISIVSSTVYFTVFKASANVITWTGWYSQDNSFGLATSWYSADGSAWSVEFDYTKWDLKMYSGGV